MSESEVWENFKQGSEVAFESLFRTFAPLMFKYGSKLSRDRDLIKDSIQHVFFQIWKNKENITSPPSVKNYLFKATRNEIFKAQSANERFSSLSDDNYFNPVAPYETELIITQAEELVKSKLTTVLAKLPERQREVIFLRYYNDLSYEEIAEIMSLEKSSVYKLSYKAIDKLHHLLINTIILLFLIFR